MLTPELVKLKRRLQGENVPIDNIKLLEELIDLENINIVHHDRSLSLSGRVCKICGRPL